MEENAIPECEILAHSNWNTLSGCDCERAIQIHSYNEDVFIKPALSQVLNEDKASLLSPSSNFNELCELSISTNGKFKVAALTFVCSSPKTELFLSQQYEETLYGTMIKGDETDKENIMGTDEMSSYRYDVEITKSGIVELSLKFISQNKELLLFGIIVFVAPNPNGITTLNSPTINLENVEELLRNSDHKLSSNAEKCKLFLESYCKNQATLPSNRPVNIFDQLKREMGHHAASGSISCNNELVNMIKLHVDCRISELEKHIEQRLTEMEKSQNSKLDQILEIISNKNR